MNEASIMQQVQQHVAARLRLHGEPNLCAVQHGQHEALLHLMLLSA